MFTAPSLHHPRLAHGFFTRRGGHSRGIYASLNAGRGSQDDPAAVEANLETIRQALGAPHLLTLRQVHSATVLTVQEAWGAAQRPEADAMVTAPPGLALGILTADCVPVLFADSAAGVIGAAHAGWKGAATGIVEQTIQAMERLGAARSRIRAATGPAIAQESYQVTRAFRENLLASHPSAAAFFAPDGPDHSRFDVKGFTAAQCRTAGIEVESLPQDTYAGEADFFSFRRTTHRQEGDYGRQLSAILLKSS